MLLVDVLFIGGLATPIIAQSAIAVLRPTTNSSVSGILTVTQKETTTLLNISLSGLKPNQVVGFHLHNFGDVCYPDASATGGHFNPSNVSHGCVTSAVLNGTSTTTPSVLPTNFHVGDVGNIQADSKGNVQVLASSTLISLSSNTIGFIIGRGVIVHAQPDDCITQPTGNAGARLAQGAIGWAINGTTAAPDTFYNTDMAPKSATAVFFSSSNSNASGMIVFTQNSPNENVTMQVIFSGVNQTTRYGLHIHAFGDISDPNGANTAGHFNPGNVAHGCFANSTRHAGDLDNVVSDASGKISVTLSSGLLSLYKGAPSFIIGRGAILHGQPDDCVTQPSGNAGARIAQGVIGYRNISLPLMPGMNPNTTATTVSSASATSTFGSVTSTGSTTVAVSSRSTEAAVTTATTTGVFYLLQPTSTATATLSVSTTSVPTPASSTLSDSTTPIVSSLPTSRNIVNGGTSTFVSPLVHISLLFFLLFIL